MQNVCANKASLRLGLEYINKQVYILQLITALETHYDHTWAVWTERQLNWTE